MWKSWLCKGRDGQIKNKAGMFSPFAAPLCTESSLHSNPANHSQEFCSELDQNKLVFFFNNITYLKSGSISGQITRKFRQYQVCAGTIKQKNRDHEINHLALFLLEFKKLFIPNYVVLVDGKGVRVVLSE